MSKIKTFGSHIVDFSIIPENGVFIDAGACQGNFIDDILEHVKNPIIYGLEPNRDNFRLITEKYKGNRNIGITKSALVGSKEPRFMQFAQFEGLPEWGNVSGLYGSRKHKVYDVQTISIRTVLDTVFHKVIHHLKMDIEGCEHKVIADLTEDDARRIQQISLEVHNGLQGMVEHLEKIGYDVKFENGELSAVNRNCVEERYAASWR